MTRYPNTARALHQLERHSSGTPGDVVAAPPSWAANLATIRDATPTAAQAMENIRIGMAAVFGKRETT